MSHQVQTTQNAGANYVYVLLLWHNNCHYYPACATMEQQKPQKHLTIADLQVENQVQDLQI
jgi:hypothetical protein